MDEEGDVGEGGEDEVVGSPLLPLFVSFDVDISTQLPPRKVINDEGYEVFVSRVKKIQNHLLVSGSSLSFLGLLIRSGEDY